jgi:hypothetical protein
MKPLTKSYVSKKSQRCSKTMLKRPLSDKSNMCKNVDLKESTESSRSNQPKNPTRNQSKGSKCMVGAKLTMY